MAPKTENLWLSRFAAFTALCTLALICVGGVVTSKGAGMAVPDWPTSYGYNMFFFPIDRWVGGIFYEHTHRLFAVLVGLLTSILAAWLWGREATGRARWMGWIVIVVLLAMLGQHGSGDGTGVAGGVPIHFQALALIMPLLLVAGVVQSIRTGGSLRWLAMTAFFAVILQGILGGLRVVLFRDQIGVFHATLAQLFLSLLAVIALLTSSVWNRWTGGRDAVKPSRELRRLSFVCTLLILAQLVLGATMRHQHAGLAIADFPTAYGKLWPAMDAASIARYNQARVEVGAVNPITAFQVGLQLMHRIVALLIALGVALCALLARRQLGRGNPLRRLSSLWFGMILLQAFLGAATIWTGKSADFATAHVAVGAFSLATGALAMMFATSLSVPARSGASAVHGRRSDTPAVLAPPTAATNAG